MAKQIDILGNEQETQVLQLLLIELDAGWSRSRNYLKVTHDLLRRICSTEDITSISSNSKMDGTCVYLDMRTDYDLFKLAAEEKGYIIEFDRFKTSDWRCNRQYDPRCLRTEFGYMDLPKSKNPPSRQEDMFRRDLFSEVREDQVPYTPLPPLPKLQELTLDGIVLSLVPEGIDPFDVDIVANLLTSWEYYEHDEMCSALTEAAGDLTDDQIHAIVSAWYENTDGHRIACELMRESTIAFVCRQLMHVYEFTLPGFVGDGNHDDKVKWVAAPSEDIAKKLARGKWSGAAFAGRLPFAMSESGIDIIFPNA